MSVRENLIAATERLERLLHPPLECSRCDRRVLDDHDAQARGWVYLADDDTFTDGELLLVCPYCIDNGPTGPRGGTSA